MLEELAIPPSSGRAATKADPIGQNRKRRCEEEAEVLGLGDKV